MSRYLEAYREGKAAFYNCIPQWENPYKWGTTEYKEWDRGYEHGKDEVYHGYRS